MTLDKMARHIEVRNLKVKCDGKCGRSRRKVMKSYPGRPPGLPKTTWATLLARGWEGAGGISRGHSRHRERAGGLEHPVRNKDTGGLSCG